MNQVEIALAAVAGALLIAVVSPWIWARIANHGTLAETTGDPCRAAFEQAPNGMLMVDAATLRIVDANLTLLRTLGFSSDELATARAFSGLYRRGENRMSCCANCATPILKHSHSRSVSVARTVSLVNVEIRGQRLELAAAQVLVFTTDDVTVRRKVEAQLLEKQQHLDHLAHHDQLTSLPNRLYLAAYLPGAIEEARRASSIIAVLFLDLDRFKHINDSRGHETGDKLLKAVCPAHSWRRSAPKTSSSAWAVTNSSSY